MIVKISKSVPCGTVSAPPSKSMAHRLIICASLSEGESRIKNIELSQDIEATITSMKSMGARFSFDGDTLIVNGTRHFPENITLYCGESGSTLRFLFPVVLAGGTGARFNCRGRLPQRPMDIYEQICENQGIFFQNDSDGFIARGKLSAGEYNVKGNISSQFITGLFYALTLLSDDSLLKVSGTLESRAYVDMTLSCLEKYGIEIDEKEKNTFFIKGNQQFFAHNETVECDWSNGAFFLAFGEKVKVEGLNFDSLQGDKACVKYFEMLKKGYCEIDISQCPDLAPILFAVASIHYGGVFKGTERLKLKESDRAECMKEELKKLGINVSVDTNSVEIFQGKIHSPTQPLCSHNDHRIAMALSFLLCFVGGEIENSECVRKSMPGWFEKLKKLGVRLEEHEA